MRSRSAICWPMMLLRTHLHGDVWKFLPSEHFAEFRSLIILLVAHAACQWHMRIVDKVNKFPLLLFACIKEEPHVKCELRQSIATRLLSFRPCCLANPFSDLALKLKQRYRHHFETMAVDGCCPRQLHVLLHMVSSVVRGGTQKVEGANSTLQHICRTAPNIHLPLCSDRLCIKSEHSLEC